VFSVWIWKGRGIETRDEGEMKKQFLPFFLPVLKRDSKMPS